MAALPEGDEVGEHVLSVADSFLVRGAMRVGVVAHSGALWGEPPAVGWYDGCAAMVLLLIVP